HQCQNEDRPEARRAQHAEGIEPGDASALLAPAAHFVKADGRGRADQGEASGEREDEWQHVVAEGEPQQCDAGQRIDEAKEDDVGSIGRKIVEALEQNAPQVGNVDAANRQRGRLCLLAAEEGSWKRPYRKGDMGDLAPSPLDGVTNMVLAGHWAPPEVSRLEGRGHPGLRVIRPLVASEPRPIAKLYSDRGLPSRHANVGKTCGIAANNRE